MNRIICLLVLLALPAPIFAQREFGFDNRKPSGQEYLKPEETVKRMKVAPEFEVKLFAGEPDCVNPIAFTIDERGRIWLVECFEYPSKTPKGKAPRDRVVILEDTDGDGKCDKRTIFAEGKDFPVPEERKKAGLGAFDMASGIEVGNGGVYIGAPPYLWFIENKNDKPGKFETVLSGFGSQDTHETLNTFQWGPDGWLYGLHGVFTQSTVKPLDGPETRMNAAVWRFHPKTKKFEIFAEGTSNPWGMDWRNTDGQFILACCVIPHLYHIVPGGIYKRQAGASFNPYAYGYINEISDHTFHKESGWAHAGLISLDAPHIPEKYRNSVIFGSIHGCSIKQNILKPKGSSYVASRGDDFLVSGDKNVRPINMKWGPHGDIYMIDWHDQNPCHQAKAESWDYERGRVYRIQVKDRKGGKVENLGALDLGVLQSLTGRDDPYLARTALRLLAERPDRATSSIKPGDKRNLVNLAGIEARGFNISISYILANSFNDLELEKKCFIIRRLGSDAEDFADQFKRFVDIVGTEKAPEVRRELASAAIRHAEKYDVTALLHALMRHKDDAQDPLIPQLVWIAYEKVLVAKDTKRDAELAFLAQEAPDNIFVRDVIVPKTMRRLVATGKAEDLKLCLKLLADVKDTNTREKALDGLVLAFAGRTVAPPEGWATLQAELRKDDKLIALLNKLAVSFRDPKALERAITMYSTGKNLEDRIQGLRDLVQLQHPKALDIVKQSLLNDKELPLLLESARQLGAVVTPPIAKELVDHWKDLRPEIQSEVAASLASRKEPARLLLQAMQKKTIVRTTITDNTIIKMLAFNDAELNKLIETAWGKTRKTPDELQKIIDTTRDSLYAAPASFARGKLVYENQCAKCHKFDGKGVEVGPQLDGAGRDIEYLLANVIDPNRVIGAPYFLRTVNLLDGQVLQGVLAEEDENFITLKIENAQLKKIAKKDLDGPIKVQEKSMMPEGLTAGMTPQNFRDLVRYAMANPFITDVRVNDKALLVGVPGRIALPKAKDTNTLDVTAEFTANGEVKTQLLLGGKGEYEVKLDGKAIATVRSNTDAADQAAVPLVISAGKHVLSIRVNYKGESAVYARFLDPNRVLSYPEAK